VTNDILNDPNLKISFSKNSLFIMAGEKDLMKEYENTEKKENNASQHSIAKKGLDNNF
jgi:hypothetical protein